jgi:hypothetical protein
MELIEDWNIRLEKTERISTTSAPTHPASLVGHTVT